MAVQVTIVPANGTCSGCTVMNASVVLNNSSRYGMVDVSMMANVAMAYNLTFTYRVG